MNRSEILLKIISDLSLEKYKGSAINFRGQSAQEKFEQLKIRYTKVIEDSANDNSIYRTIYRTRFAEIHEIVLSILSGFDNKLEVEEIIYQSILIIRAIFLDTISNATSMSAKLNAEYDAFSLIIFELISLLGS